MIQLKKILCPIDFSESSQETLQYAIHLMSKDDDATLYLIHVVDNRVIDYGSPFYGQEPSLTMVPLDQTDRKSVV